MSRYLVMHAPGCPCNDAAPVCLATSQQVARYLWGREVPEHVIYDYELPYRFHTGDLAMLQEILDRFPAWRVRTTLLPILVPPGHPICTIGDLACVRTSFYWCRYLGTLEPAP